MLSLMSNQIGKCIYPLAVRADAMSEQVVWLMDCQHFLDAVGTRQGSNITSSVIASVVKKPGPGLFLAAHVLIINMHQAAAVDLQSRLPGSSISFSYRVTRIEFLIFLKPTLIEE